MQVRDEVVGGDEVDVLVIVAAEQIVERPDGAREIVTPAERNGFTEQRGVTKRQTHGVVGADAASVDDERGYAVFGHHERDHFVEDVALVLAVAFNPGAGRGGAAVEALGIDSVDAKEPEVAGFQAILEGVDQPPVFVIEETSFARGKYENFGAGMSEYQKFHVAAEVVTKPSVILALHSCSG